MTSNIDQEMILNNDKNATLEHECDVNLNAEDQLNKQGSSSNVNTEFSVKAKLNKDMSSKNYQLLYQKAVNKKSEASGG